MKKLILSAAILLGSLSTFAQTTPEEGNATTKQVTMEATTSQETVAAEASGTQVVVVPTDGYTEINPEQLPTALTDALKKSFPTANLTKANINEKKEYKLDVEVGGRVGSLYADPNGNLIQK